MTIFRAFQIDLIEENFPFIFLQWHIKKKKVDTGSD